MKTIIITALLVLASTLSHAAPERIKELNGEFSEISNQINKYEAEVDRLKARQYEIIGAAKELDRIAKEKADESKELLREDVDGEELLDNNDAVRDI